jgi:epoxide hydrolase
MASLEPPPAGLRGMHISTAFFDVVKETAGKAAAELTEEEKLGLEKQNRFEKEEAGYFLLQSTRPQTIGYALADSPVGQAAWILEKLFHWSQHDGTWPSFSDVFSLDECLDTITLYWLTNSAASSARLYYEEGGKDNTALPISIPVGVSAFPGDLVSAPRSWGERYYQKIVSWKKVERGWHFGAVGVPGVWVREVRGTFGEFIDKTKVSSLVDQAPR